MDPWNNQSAVLGNKICVSCDQPIAAKIGIDILQQGGNAADAAVAMAVAVSVLEPMRCGLGGDCQCIFFGASDRSVLAVNGSGRSAKDLSLEKVKSEGFTTDTVGVTNHGYFVTVPGFVAGIFNCIRHFGSGQLTVKEILAPTIKISDEGVPLPYKTAQIWQAKLHVISKSKNASDLMGSAIHEPEVGEIITVPKLSNVLRALSTAGAEAFYCGEIAKNIVDEVRLYGGLLTEDDMNYHLKTSALFTPEVPLFLDFHEYRIWEMGPNTIGIIALVILNILQGFDLKGLKHNSAEYIHVVSEAIRIGFCDCWKYICDPELTDKSYTRLLSHEYAEERRKSINADKRNLEISLEGKKLLLGGNTSYLTAVDSEGNACSFIFSVSSSFGSGIVPKNCGFVLNDRGKCFSLNDTSPNAFGSRKFPLHTIIPGLITDKVTNEFIASFGVIGRWMQPQGQIQVLLNMIIFGMDPQIALNQPRFLVGDRNAYLEFISSLDEVHLEEGILPSVVPVLRSKGHDVKKFISGIERGTFGWGHVIAKERLWKKNSESEVLWGGSDPRSDGCSLAF